MRGRHLLHLLGALALAIFLTAGIALAQGPGPQGVGANLGTAFTYQGRLMDGDSPADGEYDFRFSLYDSASGDSQVGSSVEVDDVTVTDGYFTVELDFGDVFDGTALWLEVEVRPGSSTGSYTSLSPRQPLTGAPYAHHALSAPWSGLTGVPSGFADGVDDDTTYSAGTGLSLNGTTFSADTTYLQRRVSGTCAAGSSIRVVNANGTVSCETDDDTLGDLSCGNDEVPRWNGSAWACSTAAASDHDHWGESWSGSGTGLQLSGGGTGLYATGVDYGVYAASSDSTGSGVYGYATATSGANYGVYGRTDSTSGRGVYGWATATSGYAYGVYGRSGSISGRGVYGYASANSGTTYGVYGLANSGQGYGVYASGGAGDVRLSDTGTIYANELSGSDLELHSNDNVDVHLDDDANSSSSLRVFSGANTAVFTVTESGAVSWAPQTGYLSIPSAAFRPLQDGYDFTNNENRLMNVDGTSDYYFAPVYLPHGATVTRMTFYWYDNQTDYNGTATLFRKDLNNLSSSAVSMASVSSGSGGFGSSSTTAITNPTIDNSRYAYVLQWELETSSIWGYAVVIEYTYTGPH